MNTEKAGIKNCVFDFAGVICDISREQAVRRFTEIGVPGADGILGVSGQTGIFADFETGALSRDGFYGALRRLAGKDISAGDIDSGWFAFFDGFAPHPSTLAFLRALRPRFRTYLLSNTNPIIMGWARSPSFSGEGFPLDACFDRLYLSYQMGLLKPDRRIFDALCADASIAPEETLFVDDGAENICTAQSMGFHVYMPSPGEDWTGKVADILGI